MSNFIKEYPILNQETLNLISKDVNENRMPFEDSMMYSQAADEKFIDKNIRLSEFRTFETKSMFDKFKILVDEINKQDKFQSYKLVENDITHIKYKTGGFFKKHDDYLSLKTNTLTEYTMILCLDANCTGGRTIFHFNEHFKHFSEASVTNGHVVIFRKDICHEGEIIKSGYKDILTANLWCTDIKSDKTVVVSFPNDKRYYVLNYNDIYFFKDCSINITLSYDLLMDDQNEKDNIYTYESTQVDYDEFAIIYKVLTKEYVTSVDLDVNLHILDLFKLKYSDVFVDMIQTLNNTSQFKDEIILSNGITLFQNSDHARYVMSLSKKLKQNMIPFKIYFVEGTYTYGGGISDNDPLHIKMSPVFVSVGDHNNILFFRNMKTKSYDEIEMYVSKRESDRYTNEMIDENEKRAERLKTENEPLKPGEFDFSISDHEEFEANEENDEFVLDYNFLRTQTLLKSNTIFTVKNEDNYDTENENVLYYSEDFVYDCESNYSSLNFSLETHNVETILNVVNPKSHCDILSDINLKYDPHGKLLEEREYYNLDDDNKIFFTDEQKDIVSNMIVSKDIVRKVERSLSSIKLRLNQTKTTVDHDFCNENIYGSFTIIEVNGMFNADS